MEARSVQNVAIIGAGMMGSGIALVFASKGYHVKLYDAMEGALPKALAGIRNNLEMMAKSGIGNLAEMETILGKIHPIMDFELALTDVQFVIECVFEDLELKQQIFRQMDSVCPVETVLATNTSVMSIAEIGAKTRCQERILGAHFWNPPFLVPLVEVIKTENTSDQAMDETVKLLKMVGKHPVRVNKDVPGFVGNRLQHALWREAISIVEKGIADAETVDECIKYGFGMRLPVLGPIETADMVGLDLTLAIHKYILKHLENSPDASPLLEAKVARNELGFKTGQGFQSWTSEETVASKNRLIEHLLKLNKNNT